MPQVPVYDTPQALPQGLPAVRQQTPYRMMQGAQIGPDQMMKAGSSLEKFGSELNTVMVADQIQKNEAAAKDYDANLMGGIQGILYGTPDNPDSGFMNQKGKNAVDARDDTVRKLQEFAQQQSSTLTNDAQQRLVQAPTQMRVQSAITQVMQHSSQQADVYQQAAGKTRVAVAQNGAVLAYNPVNDSPTPMNSEEFYGQTLSQDKTPSAYQQYLQTIRSETLDLAQRQGITDKDIQDQMVKDAMGKVYVGVLGQMLDGKNTNSANIKLAQAYFDKVKDGLNADQQDKIKTVLEAGANKDASLNLFYEASKEAGNIAAQTSYVDDQYKAGKITAEVRDLTVQRLEHANAQRRAEQSENDKSVVGTAWDMARNGQTLADMPAGMLAYVKTRGLGPQIDAIFKRSGPGGEALDDSKMYSDLARMSAEDPAGFVKMDLSTMSGQLSQAHFNHLIGIQTSINRSDTRAMDANKLVHNTVTDAKAAMLAAGINLNPKPNTKDAETLDQFETNLRDALLAAQESWSDKKLSPPQQREEARKVAMGLLKDQALSGTGYFGTSIGQTHMPVWKMTAEQRSGQWEIPDGDRQQVKSALQKQGLPVSEDNIQRAYKLSQGVR